jgi:hemerythrin-like domain-containing protein
MTRRIPIGGRDDMEAIDTLMSEHRLIERVAAALVSFADEACRGGSDGRGELEGFVTFIREFADARHHCKEEKILFAAMVEAGFPQDGGPIAVMLMEHDQGRSHARALADLAARPAPWTAADRDALAGAARAYADLLCAHIQKEDQILYPMAEQRLTQSLLSRVDADCAAFQAREIESGEYDRLRRLGEDLVARHAPLPEAILHPAV